MSDPEVMRTVMRSPVELVDVQITGNARTKGWVIRRAARPVYFAPTTGHLLHELEGTKERLRALGIFESVEIYVDTFEDPELEFEERVSAGEPEPLTMIRKFCLAKPARSRRRSYAAPPASSVTGAESTVRAPHITASAVARSASRLA